VAVIAGASLDQQAKVQADPTRSTVEFKGNRHVEGR